MSITKLHPQILLKRVTQKYFQKKQDIKVVMGREEKRDGIN